MENLKEAEKHVKKGFSQFELSKNVLHNLKHLNLTPTGKLVLLILVDCYNPEHNAVVFPSMEYIADMAGIGLTATKQAIRDLILIGCIIKSKRSKVRGNYNKYLLTKKIQYRASEQPQNEFLFQSQKSDNDRLKSSENDCFKKPDSDRFHEEQKKEQKNNNVVVFKKNNLSSEDMSILKDYALSKSAKNIDGYISALISSGAAPDIIREEKKKREALKIDNAGCERTAKHIEEYRRIEGCPPPPCFIELRKKLLEMK